VGDQQLSATGTSVTVFDTTPFSGVVATFTDTFAGATAGQFSASIDWGDGNTSDGTIMVSVSVSVSGSGAVFSVTGGHSYASDGSYDVTVSLNDTGGAFASAEGSITVQPVAIPAATSTGSPVPTTAATPPLLNSVLPGPPAVTFGVAANAALYTATPPPPPPAPGQGAAKPAVQVPAGPHRGTLGGHNAHAHAHHAAHHGAAVAHHHGGSPFGEQGLAIVGGVTLGPVGVAAPGHAAAHAGANVAAATSGRAAQGGSTGRSLYSGSKSLVIPRIMEPSRFGGALQTTVTVLAVYHVQFRGGATKIGTVSSFRSRRHRR
jgi:hypothetical protein